MPVLLQRLFIPRLRGSPPNGGGRWKVFDAFILTFCLDKIAAKSGDLLGQRRHKPSLLGASPFASRNFIFAKNGIK